MARGVWLLFAAAALGAAPPVGRIDRMWVIGEPALDGEPKPGVYAWIDRGQVAFAVAPRRDGRLRVFQWTVQAADVELVPEGDCKVGARSARALVLVARPVRSVARCRVEAKGEVTLRRFRVGRRAAPAFVGPLARRAARVVRIGRYGRKTR